MLILTRFFFPIYSTYKMPMDDKIRFIAGKTCSKSPAQMRFMVKFNEHPSEHINNDMK